MPTSDLNRPLLGLAVGISAAQSEDDTDPGFHPDELNRSVIRIIQRLLVAGARIVVGHDWRIGGIMDTLLKSPAIEHAASIGKPGQCAIVNLVRSGHVMAPLSAELEDYAEAGILQVEPAGMPSWWEAMAKSLPPEHLEKAREAVSVMHLRNRMENLCSARICIGGKTRGFSGFYPGILEEGWRTAQTGKPLYVTSLLGGAARWMVQAAHCQMGENPEDFTSHFRPSRKSKSTYELLISKMEEEQRKILPAPDLLPVLSDPALIARSGLKDEDWSLLVDAPTADAVGVMTIRGLIKVNRV